MTLLRNVITCIGRFLSLAGVLLLIMLILLGALDALSRNLLGTGIRGAIEVTEAVLVAIVYLGIAGAYRTDSHISADIALRYLPMQAQRWLSYSATLTGALLMAFLCWFAWKGALVSTLSGEIRWGAVQMPIWPGKLVLALGVTALLLEFILSVLHGPKSEEVTT